MGNECSSTFVRVSFVVLGGLGEGKNKCVGGGVHASSFFLNIRIEVIYVLGMFLQHYQGAVIII